MLTQDRYNSVFFEMLGTNVVWFREIYQPESSSTFTIDLNSTWLTDSSGYYNLTNEECVRRYSEPCFVVIGSVYAVKSSTGLETVIGPSTSGIGDLGIDTAISTSQNLEGPPYLCKSLGSFQLYEGRLRFRFPNS